MKRALFNAKRFAFFAILCVCTAYIVSSGSAREHLASEDQDDQMPPKLGPVQADLYDTVIDCRSTMIHYDTFTRMFHMRVDRDNADDVSLYGVASANEDGSVNMRYRLSKSVQASSHITDMGVGYLVDTTLYLPGGSTIGGSSWVTDEMVEEYDCVASDAGDTQSALVILPIIIGGGACIGNQIACYNDASQELDWCYAGCDDQQPGSQDCYDCCYDLYSGDHNNCFLSCGTNRPDDDYSNCYLGIVPNRQ